MSQTQQTSRYHAVAKTLHWIIAVLIIGQFVGGKFMTHLGSPTEMALFYQFHKSFGFIVLALSIYRLYWRMTHPAPALPSGMGDWERRLAPLTHWLFYGFMIIVPLTGWLYVSAAPIIDTKIVFVIPVFHWPVPQTEFVAMVLDNAHSALATAMIGLLVLHVAAALKHHYRDRDDVFRRMLPRGSVGASRMAVPLITAALVAVAALYLIVMAIWGEDHAPEDAPAAPAAELAEEGVAAPAGDHAWVVVPEGTYVVLAGQAFGTENDARIDDIRAEIVLDLDDPQSAGRIDAVLVLSGIDAGSGLTNTELRGDDWFDVEEYPAARFTADDITGTGGAYTAVGTLTIRGVSQPIELPFTVTIEDGRAVAEGSASVDRTAFGIGGGDISTAVTVSLRVEATRAED